MLLEIELFPYPAILGVFILLALLIHRWRKDHSWPYLFFLTLFWLYILVVLYMIFFPIRIPEEWPGNVTSTNILRTLSRVNLVPFYFGNLFTANATVIFEQLIGNILLTLPFGFILPFLICVPTSRAIWLVLAAGLMIEGTQLLTSLIGIISGYGHSIDINDMILNAIGALVGYGLYRSFAWFYRVWFSHFRVPTNDLFQFFNKVTTE